MGENKNSPDSVRSVQRALQMLKIIVNDPGMSLAEVAKQASLPKTTALRILKTIEEEGLISQDEDSGRYSTGIALVKLSSLVLGGLDIRKVALPYMKDLSKKTGANVILSIAQGSERTILERYVNRKIKPTGYAPIGTQVPLIIGASGKVILANLPEQERKHCIEKFIRENKALNVDALLTELDEIRSQHYAITYDELGIGVFSIAAPIISKAKGLYASMNLAIPMMEHDQSRDEDGKALLLEATREICDYLS